MYVSQATNVLLSAISGHANGTIRTKDLRSNRSGIQNIGRLRWRYWHHLSLKSAVTYRIEIKSPLDRLSRHRHVPHAALAVTSNIASFGVMGEGVERFALVGPLPSTVIAGDDGPVTHRHIA